MTSLICCLRSVSPAPISRRVFKHSRPAGQSSENAGPRMSGRARDVSGQLERRSRTCCGPCPEDATASREADGASDKLACLTALERKVLWLSTWMIHNANHLRPSRDGLKVGGHQASSASVATLMTALYFDVHAAAGPGRGQAARRAGVPRDPVSARAAEPRQARAVPRLRRRAVLPVAHQGRRQRRFLDRLGRARRRDDAVRLAGAGLSAAASGWCRPTRRPAG